MGNTFYKPGSERSDRVHALFRRIARRYDFINDLQSLGLHRRWKTRVSALANVGKGGRALDVCCGTGDITFQLAASGAQTVGLDFTREMIEIGQVKQRNMATPNCSFILGDAQKLPFENSVFDAVTIGYGLRNLPDWEAGVREMMRVTRPGGRLVILEFGKPQNPIWRTFYLAYLRLFVPVFGLIFCGNASAYRYILESLKHYPSQVELAEKLRDLGLSNVQLINILGGAMSIHCADKL